MKHITNEIKSLLAFFVGFALLEIINRFFDLSVAYFSLLTIATGFLFALFNNDKLNKTYYWKTPLIFLLGSGIGAIVSPLIAILVFNIIFEMTVAKVTISADFSRIIGLGLVIPTFIPNEIKRFKFLLFGLLLIAVLFLMAFSDSLTFIGENYVYFNFLIYITMGYIAGMRLKDR